MQVFITEVLREQIPHGPHCRDCFYKWIGDKQYCNLTEERIINDNKMCAIDDPEWEITERNTD